MTGPSLPSNADLQRSVLFLAQAEALRKQGNVAQAAHLYQESVRACPRNSAPYAGLLEMLLDIGDLANAAAVVAGTPASVVQQSRRLQFLHGVLLLRQDDYARARQVFDSLENAPDINPALRLYQLGRCWGGLGDIDRAYEHFLRARQLGLEDASMYLTCAVAYQRQGNHARAGEVFEEGCRRHPRNSDLHYEFGVFLLGIGEYARGFELMRHRWDARVAGLRRTVLPIPEWEGRAPLRSLLVVPEQGLGEQILLAALLPALRQKVGHLAVAFDPRLNPLLQRSLGDIEFLDSSRAPGQALIEGKDAFLHGIDIGGVAPESIGTVRGYLQADAGRARQLREKYARLFPGKRLVGISWKSPKAPLDPFKSVALQEWKDILTTPDCAFICLQYGDSRADREQVRQQLGVDILQDPDIDAQDDLDGLAAQIEALDLVITISNSTAHVAGALGKPVWILTPRDRGLFWYWGTAPDSTRWYPSARLFRAGAESEWRPVLERIAAALRST